MDTKLDINLFEKCLKTTPAFGSFYLFCNLKTANLANLKNYEVIFLETQSEDKF